MYWSVVTEYAQTGFAGGADDFDSVDVMLIRRDLFLQLIGQQFADFSLSLNMPSVFIA